MVYFCIDSFSRGDIFSTQLHGDPDPNAINSRFGLFFKGGLFYMGLAICAGSNISFIIRIAKIIASKFLKIKS